VSATVGLYFVLVGSALITRESGSAKSRHPTCVRAVGLGLRVCPQP
jgi:hypothetical protein